MAMQAAKNPESKQIIYSKNLMRHAMAVSRLRRYLCAMDMVFAWYLGGNMRC